MTNLSGESFIAYCAGIIDGEGTITLKKHSPKGHPRYQVNVSVSNTNEWLLELLRRSFGGNICMIRRETLKWKPAWRWSISCSRAAKFLELVVPYLQVKGPQAKLALSFQARRDKRHHLDSSSVLDEAEKVLMLEYNHRGSGSYIPKANN